MPDAARPANTTSSDTISRLSPDQIRVLQAPIFGPIVRQDPKIAKGSPYVPGAYVISALNAIFGFDGWSAEIVHMERVNLEKYQKEGKDMVRALFSCHVRLTVRCQDGSTFARDGFGADEKSSPNLADVMKLAPKSAYTDALKDAAITLGRQFGLDTVRAAGVALAGVTPNWRQNASGQRPQMPIFAGMQLTVTDFDDEGDAEMVTENGVTYNSRTGVVQETPPPAKTLPAPATAPVQQAPAVPAHQTQPTKATPAPVQQQATTAAPAGIDRAAVAKACRDAFRAVGAQAAGQIFANIAEKHAYPHAMVAIARKPTEGGASDALLSDYLDALRAAVR